MSDPQFNDYYEEVINTLAKEPEWRVGQAAFNILMDYRPNLAEEVRATNLDPFFFDTWDGCEAFFALVEERWNG